MIVGFRRVRQGLDVDLYGFVGSVVALRAWEGLLESGGTSNGLKTVRVAAKFRV